MKVVILQPSYIPWRGYFHQVALADTFVFYDDVKYDKNGWRNRNSIKTPNGLQWLTIPVLTPSLESNQSPIYQIEIDRSKKWAQKHLNALKTNYARAPYFSLYYPEIEALLLQTHHRLADLDIQFTILIAKWLGLTDTQFVRSSEIRDIEGSKTDRLINILTKLNAAEYISGPSASNYLKPELFVQAGIRLTYMDYTYLPYPQLYPPFEPQVSILDLLFMTGPNAMSAIIPPA
ncbi:MAG: WbqC family protein [Anaerolineae bacterium]|jgi:hypothetical protein|nr:WbqC family protein [Anaerolineae bacterium]